MELVNFEPEINRDQFAKMFGGRNSSVFSCSLNEKLEIYTAGLERLYSPRLNYRIIDIDCVEAGIVRFKAGVEFNSKKLSRVMRQCDEAVCFIATIGDEIEREISRLTAQNRLSDAFIVDTLGSLLVEGLVNQFQEEMRSRYRLQGRAASLRFSPGYCDWPIDQQKKIFDLFAQALLEVRLSETCLMSPRKSISGVFGISSKAGGQWVSAHNPCRTCAKKDCDEKRI
jgi:hypothetical protein